MNEFSHEAKNHINPTTSGSTHEISSDSSVIPSVTASVQGAVWQQERCGRNSEV
jgi:hypothetical protein